MKTAEAALPNAVSSRADELRELDRRHLWHPFTQTTEWLSYDPIIVESAEGFWLTDAAGKSDLDGV